MLAVLHGVFCGTNEFGKKFLEENKKKEGVFTLPSGLQYKVLKAGHYSEHPHEDTKCDIHFEGWIARNFPNGPHFSTSTFHSQGAHDPKMEGIAASFAPNHRFIQAPQPNHVTAGMKEALLLMTEGAKWEIYVPSELGYGDEGSECDENREEHKERRLMCKHNQILGGEALVFHITLDKINGAKVASKFACDVESSHECQEKEKKYVDKMKALGPDKIEAELKRLQSMISEIDGGSHHMTPEKHGWLAIRIKLLQQMSSLKPMQQKSSEL